jgi:hypothetical protein
VLVPLLALLMALPALAPPAGAARDAGKAKGTLDEPCTYATTAKIAKIYGADVGEPVPSIPYLLCDWVVGDDPAAPLGTLRVVQLFPHFAQTTPNAKIAFQDQHAFDTVSEFELADVFDVGKQAYLNLDRASLVVQVTKKFMFSVEWRATTPETPLPKADQKRLKQLAKQIVARSPQ